ncbi:PH domain-containing protein [Streptomyces hirsutus]|uniref:PH domain-containing protein n=1 Tax=Streptomyces hirsutus TaxID=35620 RepID=UPI000AE48A56|nr:PH domain-containing protein [Streptomyces hirsutus]
METGNPHDAGTAGQERPAEATATTTTTGTAAGPAATKEAVEPVVPSGTPATPGGEPKWIALPPGLLKVRRLMLVVWLGLLTLAAGLVPGLLAGPGWAAFALLPLALLVWGWVMLERNWRSWRYAERSDDLLISRGVLWRQETVVPYGRMQLVEVTSGPLERHFGLASVQLHTAAAATDATIPGLAPGEAERLRDRLTELGEARSAGL